jgi:plasmid stabilization system protein ParE
VAPFRFSRRAEAGLRRMEIGRHVVFYREDTEGILISRILHRRMLPERHVTGAEDDWP